MPCSEIKSEIFSLLKDINIGFPRIWIKYDCHFYSLSH